MEGLTASQMSQAVHIYVSIAYSSGNVPENRRQFAESAADLSLEQFWNLKGVERLPSKPGGEAGYALRIGNVHYPHMKLTIQPYDGPPGFVFGVDSHDQFKLTADSPELAAVKELQDKNAQIARSIVTAWEEVGLPTQSGLLRRYLQAKRALADEGSSA